MTLITSLHYKNKPPILLWIVSSGNDEAAKTVVPRGSQIEVWATIQNHNNENREKCTTLPNLHYLKYQILIYFNFS